VTSSCKRGNEPSISVKSGNILTNLATIIGTPGWTPLHVVSTATVTYKQKLSSFRFDRRSVRT
jgi:hypothetical protein